MSKKSAIKPNKSKIRATAKKLERKDGRMAKKGPRREILIKNDKIGQRKFLQGLIDCGGNVREATESSGRDYAAWYRFRKSEEGKEFAEAWTEAKNIGMELLEEEARRRAYRGVDQPVFNNGVVVGTVQHYSDVLAMFLLKGGMPHKYRERSTVEHTGKDGGPIMLMDARTQFIELLTQIHDSLKKDDKK